AKRDLDLPRIPRLLTAMLTFGIAIGLTTVGVLPSYVAFSVAATALVLLSVLTVRDAYEAIDWPIVVLLGAMIPVGTAFETSGAAAGLARYLVSIETLHNPVLMLAVLMVSTMLLTDVLNNAASAIVMCPVAIHLARALEVNPDAYLIGT